MQRTNIIVYHCNFVQSSLKWRLRLFFLQYNSSIIIRLPLLKTVIRLSWTSISLINLKIKLWVTLVDWNGNFGKWNWPGNVAYFGSSFALPQEMCLMQFASSIEYSVADFIYYYCSIFSIKTSSKFATSVCYLSFFGCLTFLPFAREAFWILFCVKVGFFFATAFYRYLLVSHTKCRSAPHCRRVRPHWWHSPSHCLYLKVLQVNRFLLLLSSLPTRHLLVPSSDVFIVNFEQISDLVLVFPLLTLNK